MSNLPLLPSRGAPGNLVGVTRLFIAGPNANRSTHLEAYGPLLPQSQALADELEVSGLTGRGGAGFPVARKLRALSGPPGAIVANGSEGEPGSRKDHTLLEHAPHLVLDGLSALAQSVEGSPRLIIMTPVDLMSAMRQALTERGNDERFELSPVRHDRFVQGEASAVVSALGGGDGTPFDKPDHLTTVGLRKKPTLLYNVETLAHIALVARLGGDWFRSVGDPDDPGTRLVTLSGDGVETRVREMESGASLRHVLSDAGVDASALSAVLVGGYHGEWRDTADLDLPMSNARGAKVRVWAGVLRVLAKESCGLTTSDGILTYLASQTARQCGPCQYGLPALAEEFSALVNGSVNEDEFGRMRGLLRDLPGRGACHHPDGSVRFTMSALSVFADEAELHLQGSCSVNGRGSA